MNMSAFNDDTPGTVMSDQMANTYHLNTQLNEQKNQLQRQINIATIHNKQQKILKTMVNNDSNESILTKKN